MDCQDWDTVKVGSKTRKAPAPRPARPAGTKALSALDDDAPAPAPTKSLSAVSRTEIVRLRTAREPPLTQAGLNTACSFPPHTIRDIEAGRLCPTPTQLNVLNRVLRTALKYESK
jgi:ribosome-binding protein aMBF1 (putative translation factor)